VLTLDVNPGNKNYTVYIEKGLICRLGSMLKNAVKAEKVAVITDENVNGLYGEQVLNSLESEGFDTYLIVVDAGERSKSASTLMKVYKELLDSKITRWDCILTLGGGVVGDLGGFAAATFLRGIPYVQVPTSLIAQVDSSIGGKVGIDLPEGKNLIGSFYHPKAVFIDTNLLNTLDERFFSDGMGEVIKYGCIKNRSLFEQLLSFKTKDELLSNMEQIILTCLNIKKEVVEQDERDTGCRMILNFGHTLGHAIEKYFDYITYTHGEGVAIGMYQITKKSEQMGITEPGTSQLLKEALLKYGLPYELPQANINELINAIGTDKKSSGKYINIVLLKYIGECFVEKISQNKVFEFFSF